jgi:FSR family fosmidomycin resistance protein-like MFS transporter
MRTRPNRIGIASGVTLGLAVSLGGAFSPVLGAIADRYGLGATLQSIAGLLALAAVAGLALPGGAERIGLAKRANLPEPVGS